MITNGSFPGAADMSTSPVPVPLFPAAATTTIPLNQSLSTALLSGSDRKLVCVSPTIDRLTTRMPYCALCARIQSMPAITSLASDSPFPSAVRTSTSCAFGAPPG